MDADAKYNVGYRDYLFSYYGNKDREIQFILRYLSDEGIALTDYTTIVEGFGGSFALVRYLIRQGGGQRYTVCDIDENLIYAYRSMTIPESNALICQGIRERVARICDTTDRVDRRIRFKEARSDGTLAGWLVDKVWYAIHPGNMPLEDKPIGYDRMAGFVRFHAVDFQCCDFFDRIEQYRNDPSVFIFLDPPYFLSNNDTYICGLVDKFYDLIRRRFEYQCRMLFVINDHVLVSAYLQMCGVRFVRYIGKYGSARPLRHLYFTNKPDAPPQVDALP